MLDKHAPAVLDDAAEGDAGGAGRLAGAALEAEIEMAGQRWGSFCPAIHESADEVDAAAR